MNAVVKGRTAAGIPRAIPAHITLTDGSLAYNVLVHVDGREICCACVDKAHADTLREALNQCSWVEVSS